MSQLILPLQTLESNTFDWFYPGPNEKIMQVLQSLCQNQNHPSSFYLYGEVGKTHLLQATCQNNIQKGCKAAYMPLKEFVHLDISVLQGLDNLPLVCIDDIHVLQGHTDWQMALLKLWQSIQVHQGMVIFASNQHPAFLAFEKEILMRKLFETHLMELQKLSEIEQYAVIKTRALQRNLKLTEEIVHYIWKFLDKNLHGLAEILAILDQASLEAKKRLSLHFVKKTLKENF